MTDLTDRELQSLRNMGNECERAADEIDRLRALASQINTDWIPANRKLCDRIEQLRADYTRLLDEYDQQEARLVEAEREIERLAGLVELAGKCLVHGQPLPALEHLKKAKRAAGDKP